MSWRSFGGQFLSFMDAVTKVVALKFSSLPPPSKECPADSDYHIVHKKEKMERSSLSQCDEGKMYEVQHGRGYANIKLSSIIVDCSLDDDMLQQQVVGLKIQKEELHLIDIGFEVQGNAKIGIIEIQNNFNDQTEVHEDVATVLELLCERQHPNHDLERRIEVKDTKVIKQDMELVGLKKN